MDIIRSTSERHKHLNLDKYQNHTLYIRLKDTLPRQRFNNDRVIVSEGLAEEVQKHTAQGKGKAMENNPRQRSLMGMVYFIFCLLLLDNYHYFPETTNCSFSVCGRGARGSTIIIYKPSKRADTFAKLSSI